MNFKFEKLRILLRSFFFMRYLILFFFSFSTLTIAQVQPGNFSISPNTFEENEEIVLTVTGVNPEIWQVEEIYLWAWYFKNNIEIGGPTIGNGDWNNSNEELKFTKNSDGSFSYILTPNIFFGDSGISKVGFLES